jgi:very-short-patch-repair endonuclease
MKQVPFERSFATHPKSKFWSDLNELKPHEVTKSNGDKFWFNCNNCNHKFKCVLYTIISGSWCPFCSNKKLCKNEDCKMCFEKSFSSHEKSKFWSNKNEVKARDIFKNTHNEYLFNCNKCKHVFNISITHITNRNSWCSYCCNSPRKLCEKESCKHCFNNSFNSNEKSKYWSIKNKLKPRQVFKSTSDKYWFDCNKCNNNFECSPNNIEKNNWCPYCKNKTELKLFNWLKEKYYPLIIKRQTKFDWCKYKTYLPFDFYIEELNLLLELDGRQHFERVSNWEDLTNNDKIKDKYTIENGFNLIRICQRIVWNDKENWENQLINAINDIKINKIKLIKIGSVYNN